MKNVMEKDNILNEYLRFLAEVVGAFKLSFLQIVREQKRPTSLIEEYVNNFLTFSTLLAHEYVMFTDKPIVSDLIFGKETEKDKKKLGEKGLVQLNNEAMEEFNNQNKDLTRVMDYVHDIMTYHDHLLRESGLIKAIVSYIPRKIGFEHGDDEELND